MAARQKFRVNDEFPIEIPENKYIHKITILIKLNQILFIKTHFLRPLISDMFPKIIAPRAKPNM